MMEPIVFPATVAKVSFDKLREGTLVLKIPSSDTAPLVRTIGTIERVIKVTIEEMP